MAYKITYPKAVEERSDKEFKITGEKSLQNKNLREKNAI